MDSDYAGDTNDRKSLSGFVVKLGDAPVVWGCKKQGALALSTCEAEYYAMRVAAKGILWITRVMKESCFRVSERGVPLHSYNQAAISWATFERFPSGRAKHIDVHLNFIGELVGNSKVQVAYVSTVANDTDMFTKPLGPFLLNGSMKRLGLAVAIEEEC